MLGDLRACPKYSESTKSLFGRRIAMEESTAKSLRSRKMLTFPTVPSLENSTSPRIGAELPAAAFSKSSFAIFEQTSTSSFPSPSIPYKIGKETRRERVWQEREKSGGGGI